MPSNNKIVLIHGFLENSTFWDYLSYDFKKKQILKIEIPGHGNSSLPENINSLSEIANHIIKTYELQKLKKLDLIGHSLGGYICLEIAKQLQNINKIVLINSNFWEDSEEKKINRTRAIEVIKQNKLLFTRIAFDNLFLDKLKFENEIVKFVKIANEIPTNVIIKYSELMRDRNSYEDFVFLNQEKIHIIQGEFDNITKKEDMDTKINQFKIQNYEVVSNSVHMSLLENTNEINLIFKKQYG